MFSTSVLPKSVLFVFDLNCEGFEASPKVVLTRASERNYTFTCLIARAFDFRFQESANHLPSSVTLIVSI